MTKQTHGRIMEEYNALKNGGYTAFRQKELANQKEDSEKPTRREYYAFRNKMMEMIAEEYPVSNRLVEPEKGEANQRVLDYIMEVGMLAKIRQAGLIDDDMFSRVKCDVSRRYGIYYSFSET